MAEKTKILVIDDVKENVELLAAYLTGAGFETLKSFNGKDGIEMVKENHPALILLDIMMPDLDGFGVCEILRKDAGTSIVPIVMVTAKDKDADIVRSLEAGADDYIVKPVSKKDLLGKVESVLLKAAKGELPSQVYLKKISSEEEHK
ncbi:MAG: response regulator [Candidatus Omnitrophica bacterium]|nr:response regulator [Candidatus Omnitrophota bacterium]